MDASQNQLTFDINFAPTQGWELVPPRLTEDQVRDKFWRTTVRLDNRDQPEAEFMLCEAGVINRFGPSLRDHIAKQIVLFEKLISYGDDSDIITEEARLEKLFRFKVERIRYASLDVTLSIEGIESLAAFFAGNINLFLHVVSMYAPSAFIDAVPLEAIGRSPVLATSANYLTIEQEFAKHKPIVASIPTEAAGSLPIAARTSDSLAKVEEIEVIGSRSSEKDAKEQFGRGNSYAKAIWIASNLSLLVPVALAMIVIYVSYQGVRAEADRVEERLKRVEEREMALRNLYAEREKLLLPLLIPQSPPSPAVQNLGPHSGVPK